MKDMDIEKYLNVQEEQKTDRYFRFCMNILTNLE